jgi:hypothetical protein
VGERNAAHAAAYRGDLADAAWVPIWQAAGYLGMSAEMIERTYGHHHPEYMRAAAAAITSKQSQNVSLVVSLVESEKASTKRQKTK